MRSNIAILSTVANFDLYAKSAPLFPNDIPKYVIDGRNGMHAMDSIAYMFKKLKDRDIDWLIMADEDVVFIDSELVFGCIERMERNGITVCGIRDGGVIPHRRQNPHAINTFFSILNFKEIASIWNEKEVRSNQHVKAGEFADDLLALQSEYDANSIFEPYYCFYFWLRRKGKRFLFLDAEVPFEDDAITNLVRDDKGNPMLYHTWYARAYGHNGKHTKRIDAVFSKVAAVAKNKVSPIIFKDHTFAFKKQIKKQFARVIDKIKSYGG